MSLTRYMLTNVIWHVDVDTQFVCEFICENLGVGLGYQSTPLRGVVTCQVEAKHVVEEDDGGVLSHRGSRIRGMGMVPLDLFLLLVVVFVAPSRGTLDDQWCQTAALCK